MAKYSTGDSNSGPDNSCQLCGDTDSPLDEVEMAGTMVSVCNDCNPNQTEEKSDPDTHTGSKLPNQSKNSTDTTEQETTPGYTISNRSEQQNPEWTQNVNYGNAETPYMQKNYATKFEHALKEHETTLTELHEESQIPMESLKAIKNGNVMQEEVGRKEIEVIEELLNIELKEDI